MSIPKPDRLRSHRRFLCAGALIALAFMAACAPVPEKVEPRILAYPPPPEQARFFYERTIFGSTDVRAESAQERLRRFATGESRRGRGFSKPFDVIAGNGRIFVSDTVARRIAVLDFPGKRYYEIGTSGVGRLAKPLGMALDKANRLYVCDGTAKRVLVYEADGTFLKSIGNAKILKRPSSVAVNDDGSRIYVVDTGGIKEDQHAIHVFDQTGKHLFQIGKRGTEPGQFNLPLNATIGPKGRLYVVDTGNFRIQVFSPDGKFQFSFGHAGRVPGAFSHPKGIAVDAEGRIYVADTAFGNFQIFNSEGKLLMFIGNRNDRGGPGEYLLPAGISVDVDGRIYIVDQFFRKVEVFRPATLPKGAPIGLKPG